MITVVRNNFDNGWIGFDERTSSHVVASEESGTVLLTLRRQSSMSFGQIVVSFTTCVHLADYTMLRPYWNLILDV